MSAPTTSVTTPENSPQTKPEVKPATRSATLKTQSRAPGVVALNRALLVLLGLVLLIVGVLTLLLALDVLPAISTGDLSADSMVLSRDTDDAIAGQAWFWWAVAGLGVLVAVLSLWWLLAQARSNRLGSLQVGGDDADADAAGDGGAGRTALEAGALTDAVEGEIEGYRGVRRARAHLTGSVAKPELVVAVALDGRVGLGDVHERIAAGAVAHARQAVGRDLPTRLELSVPKKGARDIR